MGIVSRKQDHGHLKEHTMFKWIKLIFIGSALLFIAAGQQAHAKPDKVYTSWRNNLAVGGYDVVSFHQENPLEGKPKLVTRWQGADWLFANQDNLDTFRAAPEKYTPAYGGYCAWAVAKGKLAKGKPKHWTIKDGVLYLNFNKKIKDRWLKDTDVFIEQANENWPDILDD